MFGALKTKLIAAGAVLIAVLLALLKFFMARSKAATKRADRAEAHVVFKEQVEDSDSELSSDLESRKAEISKEIKDGEEITSLSDPNSDW